MNFAYRIKDWDRLFETYENRKVRGALKWIGMPTKHDGRGFRRLSARPDCVQVFCAFTLMVEVAAKMPTRGVLADEDGALSSEDLSFKTGFPSRIFESAFDVLTSMESKILWLERIPYPLESAGVRCNSSASATVESGREESRQVGSGIASPPKFEPVKKGLFGTEYNGMIIHAQGQIKRIKDSKEAYNTIMDLNVRKNIDWLKENKPDGWEDKVKGFESNKENYVRGALKPDAQAVIQAWEQRIREIKNVMNGVNQ